MDTTTLKERMELDEDMVFEDGATESGMSDEDLKIESLKIATNIGKLMNNVTTEDIVSIAETVAKFIKGGANASLETNTEESTDESPADTEEDFSTEDESEGKEAENESGAEVPTDTEEEFEI